MNIALAVVHHDLDGRLHDQLVQQIPVLISLFGSIGVRTTRDSFLPSREFLRSVGAVIEEAEPEAIAEPAKAKIGYSRRRAVALALGSESPFVLYCDCDRILHWAEFYYDELASIIDLIPGHDLTILGRTPRAFETHPHIQRDTEAIINNVFATVSGNAWDVSAAARGLSRRAGEAILSGCADDYISTDVTWPLFLAQTGRFSMGYLATEGLEFETADRFQQEITQAGGLMAWLTSLDSDPRQWAQRLDLARVEVSAMQDYRKS